MQKTLSFLLYFFDKGYKNIFLHTFSLIRVQDKFVQIIEEDYSKYDSTE